MKTRLATIAALSLAAVIGTASAAQATPPKGPGGMSPAPTTTVPKGPDKVAPTPTTQPPKGPGDIAQPQPDNDPKPPKGPGDIAQPQPDPVVDPAPPAEDDGCPACPAGEVPDSPSDNGGGNSDNGGSKGENDENSVNVDGESVETIPVANTEGSVPNDESTEAAAKSDSDGGMSPFLLLGFAMLTAGLIAFVIVRRRGDEEDAEQL